MTSRERVRAALAHQEPDRLPLDFGGSDVTSVLYPAYARLRQKLGITRPLRLIEPAQFLPVIEERVRECAGTDAESLDFPASEWTSLEFNPGERLLAPVERVPERAGDGWVFRGADGEIVMEYKSGGASFRQVRFPLAEVERPDDLGRHQRAIDVLDAPGAAREDYAALAKHARELRASSERAIVLNVGGHLFAGGQWLCGYEKFMTDLMLNRPFAEALLDRITEAQVARGERLADAAGDAVDVIYISDDLGTQIAPQLSPKLYREVIKPRQAIICRALKRSFPQAALMLHTDGAVREFIPDFIDLGIDVLNPVQVSAAGMDPSALKAEFGRDICFWGGGCDTQHVLPFGSPAQVRDEVKKRIDQLAPGGGFVFSHIHNIQAETPVENILAMLDAVRNFR